MISTPYDELVSAAFRPHPRRAFLDHAADSKRWVEPLLVKILDDQARRAQEVGRAPRAVVDSLREITIGAGKRLRPALVSASFAAVAGRHDIARIAQAGAALELFQTYLLVHDDWMDGDRVRRSRVAAHAYLGARFGDARLGEQLAVLAGDLACALAHDTFASLPIADSSRRRVLAELAELELALFHGQALDLFPECGSESATEHVSALKTGSYSVVFPMRLGAILANASSEDLDLLTRVADPLGVAFQLRDDWLGCFGTADELGKPIGSDLRNGRSNAVTVRVGRSVEGRRLLCAVEDARRGNVDELAQAIDTTIGWARCQGLDREIEQRILELARAAHGALHESSWSPERRRLLHGAIDALTERRS